MSKTETNSALH